MTLSYWSKALLHNFGYTYNLFDVDNAAFGVGSMASVGALIGHFFGGEALRNGGSLVDSALDSRPDALPGLSLGSWGHCFGCLFKVQKVQSTEMDCR